MTMRSADEIRSEIVRWRAVAAIRRPRGEMESLAAAMIVQALTWALGETDSPTIKVKAERDWS